jgi:WD40 repeat protein
MFHNRYFYAVLSLLLVIGLIVCTRLVFLRTEKSEAAFRTWHSGLMSLAISPNGDILVSGNSSGSIVVWDLDTKDKRFSFQAHNEDIYSLAFSPDGTKLAAASGDCTISIWDSTTWQKERAIKADSMVWSVAFPSKNDVIGGTSLGTIGAWNVATGKSNYELVDHKNRINTFDITSDGRLLVSGDGNGRIIVWNVKDRKLMKVLRKEGAEVFCIRLSPDGKHVGACDERGFITIWDMVAFKEANSFLAHESSFQAMSFFSKPGFLLSGGWDDSIIVWDDYLGPTNRKRTIKTRFAVRSIVFCQKTRQFGIGLANGEVRMLSEEKLLTHDLTAGK